MAQMRMKRSPEDMTTIFPSTTVRLLGVGSLPKELREMVDAATAITPIKEKLTTTWK